MDVFFISKEKRDAEKSDNGNCYVEYNKTGTGTSDMMDGLAVVTDDDNRCVFVNTIFKKIRNIWTIITIHTARSCVLFKGLYYYMRDYCNLIGLKQWYFSLIWNTYMLKLQTFFG